MRFYAVGNLDREPESEPVLRRYLEAAILTAIAARRLYADGYDAVVLHHAIYVPQGVLAQAARAAGVRVVTWNTAYRAGCFLFSHGDSYHFTMMDEPQEEWASVPWTPELREQTLDYLMSRWTGSRDWISYQSAARPGFKAADYGLDEQRPIIGMMTNVTWDAQLYYASNAFPSMREWVLDTIRWFESRPDLQLVIRIHPGRTSEPARLTATGCGRHCRGVSRPAGQCPRHRGGRSSQHLCARRCLRLRSDLRHQDGRRARGARHSGDRGRRGLDPQQGHRRSRPTRASSISSFSSDLPAGRRLDEAQQERALKYAFHFFFRRMIPLQIVRARPGWPPYAIAAETIDELKPGACPGLDIVCRGILDGTPFVWTAESASSQVARSTKRAA